MILETNRLYVRHLTLEDASRMSEYRNKQEVSQYQSWNTYSYDDAYKRILHCQAITMMNMPHTDYHLGIVLKENNELIGDIFVEVINPKIFSMGYTLDNDYWSKGYATEVLEAFLHYMKEQYHFKKVICYVYTDNIRSKKLLKRLRFMKFDESFYYDDEGYIRKI